MGLWITTTQVGSNTTLPLLPLPHRQLAVFPFEKLTGKTLVLGSDLVSQVEEMKICPTPEPHHHPPDTRPQILPQSGQ